MENNNNIKVETVKFIWVIRDGKLVLYRRTGECNRCGECCSKFAYSCLRGVSPKEAENGKYADLTKCEGWVVEDWDDPNQWQWWGPFTIIPREKLCKGFDPLTKLCPIYDQEDRPDICRKFPLHPEDMEGLSNCGFKIGEIEC